MNAPFDIDKILFSVERIKERVRELGEAISKNYEGLDRSTPVGAVQGVVQNPQRPGRNIEGKEVIVRRQD